jgi:hypothetical protein
MRGFGRKIFLPQHDFFLDNLRGHDYEMLLTPLAEKKFLLVQQENSSLSRSSERSSKKRTANGLKGGQRNDRTS